MINLAFTRPSLTHAKVDGTYLKNFSQALINWELNRQEDRKNTILRKARRTLK